MFVIEQVIIVREYIARNPAALPLMRRWAREGRLVFAPGMFTMPDSNIPSGESFLRNFLMGRDWLMANLGVEPKLCWMADIFGHNPQTPQLASLCGYTAYLFERGKNQGDDTLFWWEGIDGSRILTQWEIDTYYGIGITLRSHVLERGMEWVSRYMEKMLLNPLRDHSAVKESLLSPIGGDFRKPESQYMTFIKAYNRQQRAYRIRFSNPERYFDEVRRRHAHRLPMLKADFNPLMQGTYSSRIALKQANRRLENMAAAIDMLNVFRPTGAESLSQADSLWETIAWNAFHDIICGSLEDNSLKEALHDYDQAECTAGRLMNTLILNQQLDHGKKRLPRNSEQAVTLYNSLPYNREELVEISVKAIGNGHREIRMTDLTGGRVETQWIRRESIDDVSLLDFEGKAVRGGKAGAKAGRRVKVPLSLLAQVTLPPGSIQSYGIRFAHPGAKPRRSGPLRVRKFTLENDRLRAVFGKNGTIISLIDKDNDVELADPSQSPFFQTGMNNIMLQPDCGDLWLPYKAPVNGSLLYTAPLHDPMPRSGLDLQRQGARGRQAADADAIWWPQLRIIEEGPLRAAIEVVYRDPAITTRIHLARDEKMLRFETRFMPKGKHYRLRAAFPTSIRNGRIRCSIPCGFVERPEGEYPAQDWMDYSDGTRGLCLLNRGLPGNNVTEGVLLLSLFRAVAMEDADAPPWFEEGVEQLFEYAIRPFGPKDRDYDPCRLGMRFNRPLYAAFPGRVPAPAMTPRVEFQGAPVELMSLRRVDQAFELRFHESHGQEGIVSIKWAETVKHCRKTNVKGEPLEQGRIAVRGRQLSVSIKPFEIITLRIR